MAKTREAAVAVIGIDIGKYAFHIVGCNRAATEVVAQPSRSTARQHALVSDRHGGLRGGPRYCPSLRELGRQAAGHVERILNGAQAGELPFQGPTHFDFAINMKTANARLASRSRRVSSWLPTR